MLSGRLPFSFRRPNSSKLLGKPTEIKDLSINLFRLSCRKKRPLTLRQEKQCPDRSTCLLQAAQMSTRDKTT
ncbi:unnamed protein product [Gordionus sp. m RMFG-2023]